MSIEQHFFLPHFSLPIAMKPGYLNVLINFGWKRKLKKEKHKLYSDTRKGNYTSIRLVLCYLNSILFSIIEKKKTQIKIQAIALL